MCPHWHIEYLSLIDKYVTWMPCGCRMQLCVSVSNPLDLCILDFFELGQKIFLGWVLTLGYMVIKEKKNINYKSIELPFLAWI